MSTPVVPSGTAVPHGVLDLLLTGFLISESDDTLSTLVYSPGDPLRASDPVGIVLAWLWRNDPNRCVGWAAEYLRQLRGWGRGARADILLEDVLAGFRLAVEGQLTPDEFAAFAAQLRGPGVERVVASE